MISSERRHHHLSPRKSLSRKELHFSKSNERKYKSVPRHYSNEIGHLEMKSSTDLKSQFTDEPMKPLKCRTRLFDEFSERLKPEEVYELLHSDDFNKHKSPSFKNCVTKPQFRNSDNSPEVNKPKNVLGYLSSEKQYNSCASPKYVTGILDKVSNSKSRLHFVANEIMKEDEITELLNTDQGGQNSRINNATTSPLRTKKYRKRTKSFGEGAVEPVGISKLGTQMKNNIEQSPNDTLNENVFYRSPVKTPLVGSNDKSPGKHNLHSPVFEDENRDTSKSPVFGPNSVRQNLDKSKLGEINVPLSNKKTKRRKINNSQEDTREGIIAHHLHVGGYLLAERAVDAEINNVVINGDVDNDTEYVTTEREKSQYMLQEDTTPLRNSSRVRKSCTTFAETKSPLRKILRVRKIVSYNENEMLPVGLTDHETNETYLVAKGNTTTVNMSPLRKTPRSKKNVRYCEGQDDSTLMEEGENVICDKKMVDYKIEENMSPFRKSSRTKKKSTYCEVEIDYDESDTFSTVRDSSFSGLEINKSNKNQTPSHHLVDESVVHTPLSKKKKLDNAMTPRKQTPVHRIIEEHLSSPVSSKKKRGRPRRIQILNDTPSTPVSKKIVSESSLSTPGGGGGGIAGEPSTPGSAFKLAMSRLHVSCIPHKLPCRETEFDNIYRFIKSRLSDGLGGCMYISGVPGTGKTASVRSVVKELQLEVQQSALPNFQFIEINGLQLTEPRQVYVRILKEMTGEKVTSDQAQQILEKKFTKPSKKDLPTVLLVDELDMLCTRRQDVIYNMLDWPTKRGCRLIVITIANTMDLPERLLMGRVTSRLGLTRLTFQPYTYKQLEEIVKARLSGVKAFDADAVQFVARKVASVSGDARRALNICRRATEIAASEILSPMKRTLSVSEVVSLKHVDKALLEMFTSPTVQIIKNLSLMEQMLLKAVAAAVENTGVEKCSFKKVYTFYRTLCTFDGFSVPTSTKTLSIVAKLGSYGLVLTEHSRADIHQSLMLNISSDDLHYALQSNLQENV